jgi:chemotaxis signal transduction protein
MREKGQRMAGRSDGQVDAGALESGARLSPGAQTLLLIGRLGERLFALPATSVERILRMAAVVPLPDAPAGIAGVLDLQGSVLPVVDPRPRLGLPPAIPDVDHHLVVLTAATRYLLWIDRAECIEDVPAAAFDTVEAGGGAAVAPQVVRLAGAVLPVLSPAALDPGPIVQPSGTSVP